MDVDVDEARGGREGGEGRFGGGSDGTGQG